MAGRSVDVSLVIKAIDQSKSALDTVAKGLSSINVAQRSVAAGSGDVGKALDDLLKNLDGLSNASKILDTGLRNSVQSYSQQTAALQAANAAIDERKRKIADLERTEARLAALQGTYKTRLGKDVAGPRIPALSGVQSSLETERGKLDRDQQSIDRIIGNIATAQQGIRETKSAQLEVATAIKTVTQQYDELTAAAKRAGEAQKEALAKAAAEAQRTELGQLADRERLGAAIGRNTGTTRIPATQAGATFSALAAREETTAASAAEEVKKLEAAQKAAAEAAKEAEVAAKREAEALASLKLYARDVAEALDPAAKTSRLLAEEQDKLAAAVKAGALSQAQADAAFSKYRDELTGVAAAQRAEVRETERLAASMQELKRQIDPAAAAEEYLTQKTLELNKALKAGILTQEQYAKALAHVKAQSESMKDNKSLTLFGLRPYETQNLMFQINDVVTQLASGTSVTQTLAQQGGQILQLFPRVGNAIAGAITPMAALGVAAVAAFGLLVNRALDAEARMNSFAATVMASANSTGETAQSLYGAAEALRDYGIAAEEADKITKKLFREGFDSQRIVEFTALARDMSVVLGTDLNTNIQLLTDAYTGNWASLEKLIDASGKFTSEQKAALKALYETGEAGRATDEVYKGLSKTFDGAADKAESKWTKATRNLGNAWRDFLDYMSNSWVITVATTSINALADAMNFLSGATNRAADAERRRQALNTTPNNGDPRFSMVPAMGDPLDPNNPYLRPDLRAAPGKTNLGGKTDATLEQIENNKKLTAEMKRQEIMALKVTSQKVIQAKLDQIAVDFNLEYGNKLSASDLNLQRENKLRIERNKLEKELADYQKQQANEAKRAAEQAKREAERREKEQNTATYQAMALLRSKEGFRSRPYWDVDAWRSGYGSDTYTRSDGTFANYGKDPNVRPTIITTPQMAERDLERRVNELIDVIKKRIGGKRFDDFSATQKGAIVSLYYNYGQNADRIKKDLEPLLEKGTNEQIAAMVRSFANDRPYKKNGRAVNYDRRMAEAAILGQPNRSVDQGAEDAAAKQTQILKEYNDALDDRLSKEQRLAANQQELVGLQGEELIRAKQRQAVQEELLKATEELRKKTDNPDAELSLDQILKVIDAAATPYDNQIKPAVRETLQKSVDDLLALRDTIQQQIRSETERGNTSVVKDLEAQLDTVNGKLVTAVEKLREFLTTPGNAEALGIANEELQNILLKLDAATVKTRDWAFEFGGVKLSVDDIANAFTNNAVSAIDQFAQAVANGQNVFKSLWDAFRQFAADFLIQIAKMIQQQIIFNLVSGLLKGLAGGVGGGATATPSSSFNMGVWAHSGGVIGMESTYGADTGLRPINPAWYANAMRYHSGGIAGLKPGEVPAVLMQGEEVLTRKDPRHILNGGGGGRGDVKIVNAFDEGDVISKAMNTKAGEKAILNLVRSNPRAFKAALSGG